MRALLLLVIAGCGTDGLDGTWAGWAGDCQVGFRLEAGEYELRRACAAGVEVRAGQAVDHDTAWWLTETRASCPPPRLPSILRYRRAGERLVLARDPHLGEWELGRVTAMPGEGAATGCYDGATFRPAPVQ